MKDDCAPQPKNNSEANRIWGSRDMWDQLSHDSNFRILEAEFTKMLAKVKWTLCQQKMIFTGQEREELSQQKQLDYTIHINGKGCHPANITALLSLYSFPDPGKKSKKEKYNGKAHVGHVIRRAITVLRSAGPSRSKILVGVTNLRSIQWYTVERPFGVEYDDLEGPFSYCVSPKTDRVKNSLAAIFLADSSHLFCVDGNQYRVNDCIVEFLQYLGSGVTSCVYKTKHNDDIVAAKLYKQNYHSNNEEKILDRLKGVQGVPIVKGVAKDFKLLLLLPVGEKVKSSLSREAAKNMTAVIDTLKETHGRNIVHRDVRMGNIVLVDGSFVLIDWGFACESGEVSVLHGSLLTGSSRVIEKYGLLDMYLPQDDLISFVKSLYLFSHPTVAREMRQLSGSPSGSSLAGVSKIDRKKLLAKWDQLLEGANRWQEALKFASELSYDELRDWVFEWAVNFCP